MNDENFQIPAELQNRFKAEMKKAYKEHEKECRRNLEIRTSFCGTLSALDAGSIAVAASIGMALTARPQLLSGSLLVIAHRLVVVTIFLWVSLVCAVMHNFVVVYISKLESMYSEDEFVRKMIVRLLAMVKEAGSAEGQPNFDHLIDADKAQEKQLLRQQRNVKIKQFLHPWATALAYVHGIIRNRIYSRRGSHRSSLGRYSIGQS